METEKKKRTRTPKKAEPEAAGAETAENTNAIDAMTIEETFAALDELIDRLESGNGSLEDAFKNYEEGMRLVKSCNAKIETIEKQIQVIGGAAMEDMDDGKY